MSAVARTAGRPTAGEVWAFVHAERRALVADLADLDAEQWRAPSLCAGWDVHDVVAHLVDTALTGRLRFVRDLVIARGDFDRANARGVRRERRSDPRETLAALAAVTDLTRTPPASLATRLVEAIVHGEDVRRPVSRPRAYSPHMTAHALDYQLRTPVAFGGGRERAGGLRLVDLDTGTSWGHGREVNARGIDLLLAVSGRPVHSDPLAIPG